MYTAVCRNKAVLAVPFGAAVSFINGFSVDLNPTWVGRHLSPTMLTHCEHCCRYINFLYISSCNDYDRIYISHLHSYL